MSRFFATIACVLALAACAHGPSTSAPSPSSPAAHADSRSNGGYALGMPALWTREVVGAGNAILVDGVAVVQIWRVGNVSATQAYDVRTGRRLWQRPNTVLIPGTPVILASGNAVEFVDARTGVLRWRSAPVCEGPPTAVSYAAVIGAGVYVGCNGGDLVSLLASTGRRQASSHPFDVDRYDEIQRLRDGMLYIEGYASIGMFRRSIIVNPRTLSTVVAFDADTSILRIDKEKALVSNTCCRGRHSDSWPADIERVSLSNGKTLSSVALHPYARPLSPENDLPGGRPIMEAAGTLYVATSNALFAYDLARLNAKPHAIYTDLLSTNAIDNRYLVVSEGSNRADRQVALLDARAGMRAIWSGDSLWGPAYKQGPIIQLFREAPVVSSVLLPLDRPRKRFPIDGSCMLQASDGRYALADCRNEVSSHRRIGRTPPCITSGVSTECAQTVAMFRLF